MKRDVLVYHKVLLLLIVRRMLGVSTEESFLYKSIQASEEEIAKAVLFLIGIGHIAKVTIKDTAYYELTEKGVDSGSVRMADLFAKAIIWFQ